MSNADANIFAAVNAAHCGAIKRAHLIGHTWDTAAVTARAAEIRGATSSSHFPSTNMHAGSAPHNGWRVARDYVAEMKAKNIDAVTLLSNAHAALAKYSTRQKK